MYNSVRGSVLTLILVEERIEFARGRSVLGCCRAVEVRVQSLI